MACQIHWHGKGALPSPLTRGYCGSCHAPAASAYGALGLPVHAYRDFLTESDLDEARQLGREMDAADIRTFSLDGINVGEHAYAGALRFFARGDLQGERRGEKVLRDYLEAAILTARMAERLLAEHHFDVVVLHHGIYVPQGIVRDVCHKMGVRTVNWNPSYRSRTFIFSHDDTYHKTMISEPVNAWRNIPWDEEKQTRLDAYLYSRRFGKEDWIWFHGRPSFDLDAAVRELGLDPSLPTTGLLTSVMWDAVLHYKDMAFPDMISWVVETVDFFAGRPDRQLVIRIHPAEATGTIPSRQRVDEALRRRFSKLPGNVILVPPEKAISTYSLMDICDQVLIYNTKTGIEMAAQGKPVLVAGDAWVRGKGFVREASSREEYLSELEAVLADRSLDAESLALARKYAYHFFFRRMIRLNLFEPTNCIRQYRPTIRSLEDLRPGADLGLDLVCNGILENVPFVADD
ncbi:hypothetical protein [Pseudodesulfovibrio sp.]|uniref:capsular polysaccharide export protein, LipB/KpsS family n=1 Tax=Pseudodesulfovibrio sp. TaxID=2035812 RepID=UPI002630A001|nr:hypothetical protein [Pseudodesulfovibrio sp.]MDD3313323.1 capsule biosynthesis protein [Pseudodesulfovibrio sp.]